MGMIEAVLLAAALQDTGAGYVFTTPAGWTRRDVDIPKKAVILLPPGAGVADATLELYPPEPDGPGTPEEAHERTFRAVAHQFSLVGPPAAGTTGAFRRTRARLSHPEIPDVEVAVYTAKTGPTTSVLVFRASDAFFAKHAPDVERLVQAMQFAKDAVPPTPVHGLILPLGPGWTRKDDPQGAVVFTPPPPRNAAEPRWDYVLVVLPTQPVAGTHWAAHKALFAQTLQAAALPDPAPPTHSPDEPGPFIRSVTASRTRTLALYSARSAAGLEAVVVSGQEDRDGLRALFAKTYLTRPRREPARPAVVEAYRRMNAELKVGAAGSLQYERILLREDGVADFTTSYPDGYLFAPEVLKMDVDLQNGRIGSWKARGRTHVEIVRTAGAAPEVYARDGGRLVRDGKVWQPLPALVGLSLEGRWALGDASITFTKGRFTDAGAAFHVSGRAPKQGAGTYLILDWTLFLRYDDGAAWSCDFSTIGPDPADLSSILLRTTAFPKR
jgi:hypothetical protein